MKLDIKEILFWIVLVIAMILLIWNVFGNSPSEFIALASIILLVVMKVWSISDRQIKSENEMRYISRRVKEGFDKIGEDINLIKNKLGVGG